MPDSEHTQTFFRSETFSESGILLRVRHIMPDSESMPDSEYAKLGKYARLGTTQPIDGQSHK